MQTVISIQDAYIKTYFELQSAKTAGMVAARQGKARQKARQELKALGFDDDAIKQHMHDAWYMIILHEEADYWTPKILAGEYPQSWNKTNRWVA